MIKRIETTTLEDDGSSETTTRWELDFEWLWYPFAALIGFAVLSQCSGT